MAETPYQRRRSRNAKYTPEVAKARSAERYRRHAEAQRRANLVMKDRYPDEWRALYEIERKGIEAERGPLPGDDA